MPVDKRPRLDARSSDVAEYFGASKSLLRYANRAATRIEFLAGVSRMLLDCCGCDALELSFRLSGVRYLWDVAVKPESYSRFAAFGTNSSRRRGAATGNGNVAYASIAEIQFKADQCGAGMLRLKSLRARFFTPQKLEFCRAVAGILGLAIGNQKAQWALRERVKELTCLYGISRIAQESGLALDVTLQQIVDLLPAAWQFPEIACARIQLDRQVYTTAGFREAPRRQTAPLVVAGKPRGQIDVVYTGERPEFAEGPFLFEEQSLIDTIAREVGLIVERRESATCQSALHAQLRHADRLATIGQLAAGVAHELNEPLGSILGFAQLMQQGPALPEAAAKDAERIVKAALHAREVIHKLLVFSRQKTPVKTRVDLNRIVEEGLYFLEARCAKAGITLISRLSPDLPPIHADASQMHQVLVNLVVNGIQAMPEGGVLTIETRAAADSVWLGIQDTGVGMADDIKEKIYTPFFTTKDVDQGTGLGLAVVHGIVTSHGGTIRVESSPGQGARFEVRLPAAESHE